MTLDTPTSILLDSLRDGKDDALGDLLEHLEGDLKKKAAYFLANEHRADTLQPTALVNEACMRLAKSSRVDWNSRAHFLGAVGKAMERVLVDHVRRKTAKKRGGETPDRRLDHMEGFDPPDDSQLLTVLMVRDALAKLEQKNPRQAAVARFHKMVGMTLEEVAKLLKLSKRTVQTDWRAAQLFLERELRKQQS